MTVGKVSIDYLDAEFGHSLLMLAVANDLPDSTDKLLKLADGEDSSYVVTPMFIARSHFKPKSLIKYGGNVDDQIKIRYVENSSQKRSDLMEVRPA